MPEPIYKRITSNILATAAILRQRSAVTEGVLVDLPVGTGSPLVASRGKAEGADGAACRRTITSHRHRHAVAPHSTLDTSPNHAR